MLVARPMRLALCPRKRKNCFNSPTDKTHDWAPTLSLRSFARGAANVSNEPMLTDVAASTNDRFGCFNCVEAWHLFRSKAQNNHVATEHVLYGGVLQRHTLRNSSSRQPEVHP